jgi:phasin
MNEDDPMNTKNPKPKTATPFENGATETPQIPFMGNGSFAAFQFPNAFREIADKSVSQARDTYAKLKTAAEDATDLVESTVEAARDGAFALGVKALDAAKSNSDASFALARDLFGAKTFSEVIELQSTYARRLFESVTAQFKEMQELTEKVVADTTKPVAEKVEKTFKSVAA